MNKIIFLIFNLYLTSTSFSTLADPYSKIALGQEVKSNEIESYYRKKNIYDKESLILIGSKYEGSDSPIIGTGFSIVDNFNTKYIVTNSHLIDGDSKFYLYKGKLIPIQEKNVLSCANNDVAIVELDQDHEAYFGDYFTNRGLLDVPGMNNSPRGHRNPFYKINDKLVINKNNRPLFRNFKTGELLSYVQIGNMYDLSCNSYPSSPEPYMGNALFVPVSQALKEISKEPIPYSQNHYNRIGRYSSKLDFGKYNRCVVNLDSKVMEHEKTKQSILSKSILTPASIVPGMSGSPLLLNNDLTEISYKIVGIATAYDRLMQRSIFTSHSKIKACIRKHRSGKRGNSENVFFKYSKKYKSTYRSKVEMGKTIDEVPQLHGKANSKLANSKINELYQAYLKSIKSEKATEEKEELLDNSINVATIDFIKSIKNKNRISNVDNTLLKGGNGYGNGGDSLGVGSTIQNITIPTGISINNKAVIGFKCQLKNKNEEYIFANWEALGLEDKGLKCEPIYMDDNINIIDLLQTRVKNRSSNKSHNTDKTFSVKSKLQIKKGMLKLTLRGKYTKENKKFTKTIVIDPRLNLFEPRLEIKLNKNYSIIADIKELFFTDMLNVENQKSVEKAISVHTPRVYYSLKKQETNKGSIPIINHWEKK